MRSSRDHAAHWHSTYSSLVDSPKRPQQLFMSYSSLQDSPSYSLSSSYPGLLLVPQTYHVLLLHCFAHAVSSTWNILSSLIAWITPTSDLSLNVPSLERSSWTLTLVLFPLYLFCFLCSISLINNYVCIYLCLMFVSAARSHSPWEKEHIPSHLAPG